MAGSAPLDPASDGYATGLVAFVLKTVGIAPASSLDWLWRNLIAGEGRWAASSVNKKRDLESDAGR